MNHNRKIIVVKVNAYSLETSSLGSGPLWERKTCLITFTFQDLNAADNLKSLSCLDHWRKEIEPKSAHKYHGRAYLTILAYSPTALSCDSLNRSNPLTHAGTVRWLIVGHTQLRFRGHSCLMPHA